MIRLMKWLKLLLVSHRAGLSFLQYLASFFGYGLRTKNRTRAILGGIKGSEI